MELYEYFYPDEFRDQPLVASSTEKFGSLLSEEEKIGDQIDQSVIVETGERENSVWKYEEHSKIENQYSLETFELGSEEKAPMETTNNGEREKKQDNRCHVCDSPTANTLHFGGRSCKACAAFFRRSVSMSMTYECIGNNEDDSHNSCKIHFELRMLCRHCRFIKCLLAGMKKDLVQAKKEEIRVGKRKSKGLVRCFESKQENNYQEYIGSYTPQDKVISITPKSDLDVDAIRMSDEFLTTQNQVDLMIPSVVSLSPSPLQETNAPSSSFPIVYDSQEASTSSEYYVNNLRERKEYIPSPYTDQALIYDHIFTLIDHYVRTESAMNNRRRIMYTETPIRDVFDVICECPFERHNLKLFSYQTFCGFVKHDFVMLLDYVNQFPDFSKLMRDEKNTFYRMACAVDSMMSSAYYTYRTGIAENFLVLFNGDYIPMEPAPMTGNEPDAAKMFGSEAEHMKYKTLMPLKMKQYHDMAVPFSNLGVSFEEFVLLKALTIWHITYYKLYETGRAVCSRQRDSIIQALYRVVEDRGDENPATRVGQLLLSMSYIIEQVQAMTASYLMITFFDVVACDSILTDLLSFKY